MRVALPILMTFAAFGLLLLCSCATNPTSTVSADHEFVRKVDFSQTPEMREWVERARRVSNEMYPKVCALMADDVVKFPRQFDIRFKKQLTDARRNGEAPMRKFPWTPTISINASRVAEFKKDPGAFDSMLIHEMAHLTQQYRRPFARPLGRDPDLFCWEEGIPDYVSFKLSGTNENCWECNFVFPHYQQGYSCAAALLLYIENNYSTNIIRELNTALRRGSSDRKVIVRLTGKSTEELWTEFQSTPGFTPRAMRMLELQKTIGYRNGRPPKDVEARLKKLVEEHADLPVKEFYKIAFHDDTKTDLIIRLSVFLYLTQPGGAPEPSFIALRQADQLPGFSINDDGSLMGNLNLNSIGAEFATPSVSRTFRARKSGDDSTYHYSMVRNSPDSHWKLGKAWRTAPDGQVLEEFPVP